MNEHSNTSRAAMVWRVLERLATADFDCPLWSKTAVVDSWVILRLALIVAVIFFNLPRHSSWAVGAAALLLFENLWYQAGVVIKGGAPRSGLRLLVLTSASYVAAALCFAAFYAAFPTDFNCPLGRFDAVYFSFVTIGTIGFGDIVPVSKVVKAGVIAEHLVGLYYLAVVLVVIVGLARSPRESAA